MLINWFTIIAQIFNFLILLWLLRRFLYRPILDAMDQREQLITLRLKEAERSQAEADAAEHEYRQLTTELADRRHDLISQAQHEAEEKHRDMLRQARQEVEKAQESWYKAIHLQRESLIQEVNQRTSQQTISIARRALADLADADLERQIVRIFLSRLDNLDGEHRTQVNDAFQKSGQAAVRTAFDLPEDLKSDIIQAVKTVLPVDSSLSFERDNSLIGGIELKSGGQKISWSLRSYLESLEESLLEVLHIDQEAVIDPALLSDA